ncbi:carbon-nitrogen hydrolase family protein [Clostridium sp. WILCCON 0269]|uniref:Carbon-nitrogen hydrolase family protein n=1 Tax=Candidatus Clostridium eludens TaxID=3381663 RepID=A0ABW8SGU9_9CLOT
MIKVAAAQIEISENIEENYHKSLHYIREAAKHEAEFICFPEGQLSKYIPQYKGLKVENYAIVLDHPYIKGFCEVCRQTHIIASIALCLKIDEKVFASNMIISENGNILGIGKKNHIVQAEHFYEQDYFTPGNEGFKVVDTSIGKIGIVMCFDRHYPESYRTCVLKGADFIVVPVANEKIEPSDIFQWEIRIAAFQNSVNLIMCNRVGLEGNMDFSGESLFVNSNGSIASLAGDQEQLLFAELDIENTTKFRKKKQYLSLRRSEIFELD